MQPLEGKLVAIPFFRYNTIKRYGLPVIAEHP